MGVSIAHTAALEEFHDQGVGGSVKLQETPSFSQSLLQPPGEALKETEQSAALPATGESAARNANRESNRPSLTAAPFFTGFVETLCIYLGVNNKNSRLHNTLEQIFAQYHSLKENKKPLAEYNTRNPGIQGPGINCSETSGLKKTC
ncbi:MAG TPA: hypothetical protein PKI19_13325 [Elusimicrobiales bacterium]|nr:hypothetical protein [Elusimicrobiales bacterium]